ncbi:hypothetical protein ACLOJK_026742 [Asimina triloba]
MATMVDLWIAFVDCRFRETGRCFPLPWLGADEGDGGALDLNGGRNDVSGCPVCHCSLLPVEIGRRRGRLPLGSLVVAGEDALVAIVDVHGDGFRFPNLKSKPPHSIYC